MVCLIVFKKEPPDLPLVQLKTKTRMTPLETRLGRKRVTNLPFTPNLCQVV
jgi:hypothetical protein